MRNLLIFAAILAGVATPACAEERSGFRLETRATYETPAFSGEGTGGQLAKLGSAVAMGAELGYDFELAPRFAVGPYLAYDTSGIEACDPTGCIAVRDNLAAGLQAALQTGERGSVYAKVGYAALALEADLPSRFMRDSGSGYQLAIGYEYAFGRNFYGRVESGYANNGRIFAVDFQRFHTGIAMGVRF